MFVTGCEAPAPNQLPRLVIHHARETGTVPSGSSPRYEAHPKAVLLCHTFCEYLTLFLTTRILSVSDIHEAQENFACFHRMIMPFPAPCTRIRD